MLKKMIGLITLFILKEAIDIAFLRYKENLLGALGGGVLYEE